MVDPSGSQQAIAKPHLQSKQPNCMRVSGCDSPRGGSASRSVDGSPGTRHRAPASFSVLPAFLFYIEVHSALHDLGIWSCLPRSFSPLFLVFERRSMSGGSSAPPGFLGWRRVSARGWAFRGLSWIVWARWDCCELIVPTLRPVWRCSVFAPMRLGAFSAAPSVSFVFELLLIQQHSLSWTMASWPRILGGPSARVFVP